MKKLFLNDTTSISTGTCTRVYRYTRVHVADAILKDILPVQVLYHHFTKKKKDIFFLKEDGIFKEYTLYCTTGRVWCTMVHCVYTVSTLTPILQGIHTHNIYLYVCVCIHMNVHVYTSSVSYLKVSSKNFTYFLLFIYYFYF